jgi:hypothetical protein
MNGNRKCVLLKLLKISGLRNGAAHDEDCLFWVMSTMSKFTIIIGTRPMNISFHAWYLFYGIVIKNIALQDFIFIVLKQRLVLAAGG